MWASRTKLLRGVVAFLIGCALLGFIMGLKGALPRGGTEPIDSGPPAAPTDGVIIEAAPIEEEVIAPADKDGDDEPAKEAEKAAEPEKAPEPKTAAPPPPPAPKEEPPPSDPVGELLEAPPPPPDAVIY
jgi:hypothetical protein